MTKASYFHRALLLDDGTALVIGGVGEGDPDGEIYHPQ
jgi:hypothetical protein